MRKASKSQAKNKAWKAFSKYIRVRDAYKTTGFDEKCVCITCGQTFETLTGHNCIQAGHFIQGRLNGILFEEKGCHGQCRGCNVWANGRTPIYEKFMRETYGQEVIDDLWEKARSTVQYKTHDYLEIEDKYKQKLKDLEER